MTRTLRKSIPSIGLLAYAALATLPGATAVAADPAGKLAVLEWAGYDAQDYWIDFKKKYPAVKVGFRNRRLRMPTFTAR